MQTIYLPFEFSAHDPQKFDEYTELPNGFLLKGEKLQYLFDEKKGWCDKNGCYYNSDGQPNGWIILSENREKYKLFSMDKEQLSEGDNQYYFKFSESYQRNQKQKQKQQQNKQQQKQQNKQQKGQNEVNIAKESVSTNNIDLKKNQSENIENIENIENSEQQKEQKNEGNDIKYNKTEQKIINDEKNKERATKKYKNQKNNNTIPQNTEVQKMKYIKKSELEEEQQNKNLNAEEYDEDNQKQEHTQEQNDDNKEYNSKQQKNKKKHSLPIIIDIKNKEENLTDDDLIANLIAISNIPKESIIKIINDQLYLETIEDAIAIFLQNQEQIKTKSNKYIIEL